MSKSRSKLLSAFSFVQYYAKKSQLGSVWTEVTVITFECIHNGAFESHIVLQNIHLIYFYHQIQFCGFVFPLNTGKCGWVFFLF